MDRQMKRFRSFFTCFAASLLVWTCACSQTLRDKVQSKPPGAEIYWGKAGSDLQESGFTTPHTRTFSESKREPWCYQVKKKGYHDSEVYCRDLELSMFVDIVLTPLQTVITSDPPGAPIFWGPSMEAVGKTDYTTPHEEADPGLGASYKDWYFQVKKEGFKDSGVIFSPQEKTDRHVHFALTRKSNPVGSKNQMLDSVISGNRVTLAWEDASVNEDGFQIEKRIGPDGEFFPLAEVGPNITKYTDTDIVPGGVYFYRVRSFNAYGHSAYSQELRVSISR